MGSKKIGIITFHCSFNYGSALQAFALQTYLNNKGYKARIIDFRSRDFLQYKLIHIPYIIRHPRAFSRKIIHFSELVKRNNSFHEFWNEYFKMTKKTYYENSDMSGLEKNFDTFICGSDQIWNIDCTKGIVPAFFLDFAENSKKIAYAPSIAHLSLDNFNNYKSDIKKYLESFSAISVREKSTIPVLQELTDKEISETLDPTLLLDREDYEKILEKKEKSEKYIFFYMLEYNPKMMRLCADFADRRNLKVYYLCGSSPKKQSIFKNAENVYGISPIKFLQLIRDADYIITNSFHATVFSIQFEKKFCTFKTEKSYSRMTGLLNNLGIESQIYSKDFKFKTIDYEPVRQRLLKLRESSEKFLLSSLDNEV